MFCVIYQRSFLSKIGGHGVASNTYRVMKACVTYGCASNYSLLGQRSKKSFSSLPLYRVIVRKYFCLLVVKRG